MDAPTPEESHPDDSPRRKATQGSGEPRGSQGGQGAPRRDAPRKPRKPRSAADAGAGRTDVHGRRRPEAGGAARPGTERGERKPWENKRPAAAGERGERKPWENKRPAAAGERGERGERKPWENRGASGSARPSAGGKKLWTRDGAPARGDRDAHRREQELTEQERLHRELKSVRPRHQDPLIDEDVTADQLDRIARNELKTLSKDNAEGVAKHLVMAARLIDDDPALAHEHALSAARRAGRIAMVRETLAITAYGVGDFALALRELRTYRRISGSNNQLPLMVDSERGVGRPDRALELGRSVQRSTLPGDVQASLAIAMSGARLDQGDAQAALAELEIAQLDPERAFAYSPDLFSAYAEVLEELGRDDEAALWRDRADRAQDALDDAAGDAGAETVEVIEEQPEAEDASGDDVHTQED